MFSKNSFFMLPLIGTTLLFSHTAVADSAQLTQAGNKTAAFYASFFMSNLQQAAQHVPSLSATQKECVQDLSDDVMLPAFQKAIHDNLSAQDRVLADEVHSAEFQSAFLKITNASRQKNMDSLQLSEAEKSALKKAKGAGVSNVSTVVRSAELKKQGLALFEKSLKSQCGIEKIAP